MSELESWAEAKPDKAGGILVRYAHALESRLETRLRNWEIYAAVFSEQLETSLRPSRQRWLQQPAATRNANLTFNVGRSLCETEHATVSEAEPRPMIQTEDGSRPEQDKAIELQRAVDGILSDLRGYSIFERAELDKCVLGTGVNKIHRVLNRPAIDRILISDILVDEDLLGAGQDPKQIIHRQEVSRAAMLVYFEEWFRTSEHTGETKAKTLQAIKDAPAVTTSVKGSTRADLIAVYDAYTLPIDEDHPGRHGIAIENFESLLFVEPWKKPRLPFVFQFWQRPTTGFYGIGIIEQVLGIQVEINRFYRNVSRALKNWGVPTALIPTLSKINTQQWHNSPDGKLMTFDPAGGQPVMWGGQILSPEVMQWLDYQIENAYKVTGIPQNVAFAQREAGIPSAQGQRELSQKAAARLGPQSKQYERAIVDAAWLLDDVIREIVEDGGKLEVSTADQGNLHKVDIDKAISLKPGSYKYDIFAGNLLSRHPATKVEQVQEYAKNGIFTPDDVRKLAQMPDVTAALGKTVDIDGIYRKQIDAALDKGTYTRPEAFWPAKERGVKLYADALFENQSAGVAGDRLQILRDWLTQMKDIMQPPTQAPTPGAPPDASQPPAPPPAAQQPPQQEAA